MKVLLRACAVLFICLCCATPAWAALAVTTTATKDQDANADPWTFTVDTVSGDNLLVVQCFTSSDQSGGDPTVTHNGDAPTALSKISNASAVSYAFSASWVNPDIGTGLTVSVDWFSSTSSDGGCIARVFSGASTVTGAQTATSTGDSFHQITVTCPSGAEILAAFGLQGVTETPTYASGQSAVFQGNDGGNTYDFSRKDGGGDGVMSWDWTTNANATMIGVCVNAAVSRRPIAPIILQ
jgi:hypothetical protein